MRYGRFGIGGRKRGRSGPARTKALRGPDLLAGHLLTSVGPVGLVPPKVMWLICDRSRGGQEASPADCEFSSNTSLCQRPGGLGQGSKWRERNSGLQTPKSFTARSGPIAPPENALVSKVFRMADSALGFTTQGEGASRKVSGLEQRCQELHV